MLIQRKLDRGYRFGEWLTIVVEGRSYRVQAQTSTRPGLVTIALNGDGTGFAIQPGTTPPPLNQRTEAFYSVTPRRIETIEPEFTPVGTIALMVSTLRETEWEFWVIHEDFEKWADKKRSWRVFYGGSLPRSFPEVFWYGWNNVGSPWVSEGPVTGQPYGAVDVGLLKGEDPGVLGIEILGAAWTQFGLGTTVFNSPLGVLTPMDVTLSVTGATFGFYFGGMAAYAEVKYKFPDTDTSSGWEEPPITDNPVGGKWFTPPVEKTNYVLNEYPKSHTIEAWIPEGDRPANFSVMIASKSNPSEDPSWRLIASTEYGTIEPSPDDDWIQAVDGLGHPTCADLDKIPCLANSRDTVDENPGAFGSDKVIGFPNYWDDPGCVKTPFLLVDDGGTEETTIAIDRFRVYREWTALQNLVYVVRVDNPGAETIAFFVYFWLGTPGSQRGSIPAFNIGLGSTNTPDDRLTAITNVREEIDADFTNGGDGGGSRQWSDPGCVSTAEIRVFDNGTAIDTISISTWPTSYSWAAKTSQDLIYSIGYISPGSNITNDSATSWLINYNGLPATPPTIVPPGGFIFYGINGGDNYTIYVNSWSNPYRVSGWNGTSFTYGYYYTGNVSKQELAIVSNGAQVFKKEYDEGKGVFLYYKRKRRFVSIKIQNSLGNDITFSYQSSDYTFLEVETDCDGNGIFNYEYEANVERVVEDVIGGGSRGGNTVFWTLPDASEQTDTNFNAIVSVNLVPNGSASLRVYYENGQTVFTGDFTEDHEIVLWGFRYTSEYQIRKNFARLSVVDSDGEIVPIEWQDETHGAIELILDCENNDRFQVNEIILMKATGVTTVAETQSNPVTGSAPQERLISRTVEYIKSEGYNTANLEATIGVINHFAMADLQFALSPDALSLGQGKIYNSSNGSNLDDADNSLSSELGDLSDRNYVQSRAAYRGGESAGQMVDEDTAAISIAFAGRLSTNGWSLKPEQIYMYEEGGESLGLIGAIPGGAIYGTLGSLLAQGYTESELSSTARFQFNYFANDYDPPEGKATEPVTVNRPFAVGDEFQIYQGVILGSPATIDNANHDWDKHGGWDPLDLGGTGYLPTGSLRALGASGTYNVTFEYEPQGLLSFGIGRKGEPIFFIWGYGGIFASYGRVSVNPSGLSYGVPLGEGYDNGFSGINPIFELKLQLETLEAEQKGLGYSEGSIKTYILPSNGDDYLPLSEFPIATVEPEAIEHPLFSNLSVPTDEREYFWRWWLPDIDDPETPNGSSFALTNDESPVSNETLGKNSQRDSINFTGTPQTFLDPLLNPSIMDDDGLINPSPLFQSDQTIVISYYKGTAVKTIEINLAQILPEWLSSTIDGVQLLSITPIVATHPNGKSLGKKTIATG